MCGWRGTAIRSGTGRRSSGQQQHNVSNITVGLAGAVCRVVADILRHNGSSPACPRTPPLPCRTPLCTLLPHTATHTHTLPAHYWRVVRTMRTWSVLERMGGRCGGDGRVVGCVSAFRPGYGCFTDGGACLFLLALHASSSPPSIVLYSAILYSYPVVSFVPAGLWWFLYSVLIHFAYLCAEPRHAYRHAMPFVRTRAATIMLVHSLARHHTSGCIPSGRYYGG